MSEIVLQEISELYNYTNISKLIVFHYLTVHGNQSFGNYDESIALNGNDVYVYTMDVKGVNVDTSKEVTLYTLADANSECFYHIQFSAIYPSFSFVIQGDLLIIYKKFDL